MFRNASTGLALVVLAWCALPAKAGAQEQAERPELEALLLRTWTDGDLTIVDGLAHVPLSIMAGGTAQAYRFDLAVFGEDGTQLYRDSWDRTLSNRAAAYADVGSSTLLEPFRFGVMTGAYEVELRAYPTDAPDLGTRTRLSLEAFAERPVASDLFLADRVEPLDEEGGGSWSITHGGFGIAAVARTTVLPQEESRLFYYMELYGVEDTDVSLQMAASVMSADGRAVYTTPTAEVTVPAGGLPYAGNLSLAGLPPGDYELSLEISGDAISVQRAARFRMLARSAIPDLRVRSYESEYFASLSDAELQSTFGGVGYLVSESERQAYQSLPPDAQRRYLTEFFMSQNPNPGTMSNVFLEEYIERVGLVRMQYGELVGTGERPPWTTDAGRIYLKYGTPDERVLNHFPSGSDTRSVGGVSGLQGEAPYEIWSYHSTGYVYLFIQESQFGVWRMIMTTDQQGRSLADWQTRVGGEALRDLSTKFGIQPRY